MTREELRDYVDEQRELDNIPYHVYSALIDGIDTLEQEPTSEMVHVETLRQVMWERDIAIEQLHELGYDFGQKIEPCDDDGNNLCNSCTNIGCEFQSGIVRTKCAFYMPPRIESDNCGNYVVMQPPVTQKSGFYCDTCEIGNPCLYCKHEFEPQESEDDE